MSNLEIAFLVKFLLFIFFSIYESIFIIAAFNIFVEWVAPLEFIVPGFERLVINCDSIQKQFLDQSSKSSQELLSR